MDTESDKMATTDALKPKRTFGRHVCHFCGVTFTATHNRQGPFCTTPHKNAFQDLQRVRGRALVKLLQAWRLGRNTKDPKKKATAAFALDQLCAMGDLYNQEDTAAGRPSALVYVASMEAIDYRPATDRKRR